MSRKVVYIIAGPNGSGKTTFAKEFVAEVKLPFKKTSAGGLSAAKRIFGIFIKNKWTIGKFI